MLLIMFAHRQEFLSEASDFNKSYDLQGKGLQYREQQTRKKIALIQDEILLLETGLLV